MKRNNFRFFGLTIFLAGVFLFTACNQFLNSSGGSITVNLPNGNARLAASDLSTYTITLLDSSGKAVKSVSVSGGSCTIDNIVPGDYTISVGGGYKDSDGMEYKVASGKASATVTGGETAEATVTMKQTGFFVAQGLDDNDTWKNGDDIEKRPGCSAPGCSPKSPYMHLQTAIDKIAGTSDVAGINDGETAYTIYVKGNVFMKTVDINNQIFKMAEFSFKKITKPLNLSIVGVDTILYGEIAKTALIGKPEDSGYKYGPIVQIGNSDVDVPNLNLTLENLTISDGKADQGAGIFNNGGTITLKNCTITNNTADMGSGIYSLGGTIIVDNTSVISNSYTDANNNEHFDQGIQLNNSTLTIKNKLTLGNSIRISGDSISIINATTDSTEDAVIIRDDVVRNFIMICLDSDNSLNLNAPESKRRIVLDGNIEAPTLEFDNPIIDVWGTLNAYHCDMKNNFKYADYSNSAAILASSGKKDTEVLLSDCTISNCGCQGSNSYAGGIWVEKSKLTLKNTKINCSSPADYGNDVSLRDTTSLVLDGVVSKSDGTALDVEIASGANPTIILAQTFDADNSRIKLTFPTPLSKEVVIKNEGNTAIGEKKNAFTVTNDGYCISEDGKLVSTLFSQEVFRSRVTNYSEITTYTVPDGYTSIGEDVFADCTALKDITLPASITSIGSKAFSGATNLETLTINSSTAPTLTTTDIFEACTKQVNITVSSGAKESYTWENSKWREIPSGKYILK